MPTEILAIQTERKVNQNDGKTNDKRIAYVSNKGDGPFSDCEWKPTIKPGEAYF